MQQNRSEVLDAVRGVAIAFVLGRHYFPQYMLFGAMGVDLFFVLSGYLIGGILLDNRQAPNFFSTFYWRRAFRILPLYWLFLAFCAHPTQPLWWYLVFGQSFGWMYEGAFPARDMVAVTWSLALEEQFYLIMPTLVFLLPRRWLVRVLWCCVLAAPLWRVALGHVTPVAWLLLPCRLDSLMGGVLIACFARGYATSKLTWAALALLAPSLDVVISLATTGWLQSAYYSVIAFVFAGLILLAVSFPSVQLTILGPVAWLGIGAYAIYLFHLPTIDVLILHNVPFEKAGMLALPIVLGIAWASWRYIEAPLIMLARSTWRYDRPRILFGEPVPVGLQK
jgi:peptidoglycan/LPS O-acetylase OafA/YrhL